MIHVADTVACDAILGDDETKTENSSDERVRAITTRNQKRILNLGNRRSSKKLSHSLNFPSAVG